MADELLELVKTRNLSGKAIVVGHSLGAMVSMIAEIKNPGTFRGLWCFEPVLFSEKRIGQYYSKVGYATIQELSGAKALIYLFWVCMGVVVLFTMTNSILF